MSIVNTVLGTISADDLGVTLVHEHFACGHPGERIDLSQVPYDRDEAVRTCVQALQEAKSHGVRTIVDATPIDLGRDAELHKRVSAASSINVVTATGFYMDLAASPDSLPGPPHTSRFAEIYETFMTEITKGIGDTGVKAGVIKVATGHGRIAPYEEEVLKAAARAQRDTGVPIITHTEAGTMGPEQADLLISEGVEPTRIMIGHMGGSADLAYHTSVLERGVFIAFDRLGLDVIVSDSLRIACIVGLIGIGFARRIMLSHDYVPFFIGQDSAQIAAIRAVQPNWHYAHVLENVIPSLREAGVAESIRDTIMIQNPQRLFA